MGWDGHYFPLTWAKVYSLTIQFYLDMFNANDEPKIAQETKENQSKCWGLVQNNSEAETVWNTLFSD